ncbi:MAG: hypothetical protein GDA44_11970 [Prochloron sp. SP5CPC1]|nr:hypothetical protein [Candidatus Paraprochloron terpiosi SP5CPC1]
MWFLESIQFNQMQGRGNTVKIAGITLPLPQKDKFTSLFGQNLPIQPIFLFALTAFLTLISTTWLTSILSSQKSDSNLTTSISVSEEDPIIPSIEEQKLPKFVCGEVDGVPATIVRTPQGNVPIIFWKYTVFNLLTPQIRCEQVYYRFKTAYETNKLKLLTTDRMNGEHVVFATNLERGACTMLLFRGVNQNET